MRLLVALAIACCGSAAAAQPASDPVIALPPLESLKATRDRPLFSPNRRPPAVQETPDAPAAEERAASEWEFELSGVVMGPEISIAVLRHKETNEIRRVTPGETINEWTVASIASRSVVVRNDSRSVTMELFVDNTPKGDPAMPMENTEQEPRRPLVPPRQDRPKSAVPRER